MDATRLVRSTFGLALLVAPSLAFATPAARRAAELSNLAQRAIAQPTANAKGPVADLIARTRAERDPRLQRLLAATLVQRKVPLTRAQKWEVLGLARDRSRGLLPKTPPLPEAGAIEVRHYTMGEFFREQMNHYRAAGFEVTETGRTAQATRGRLRVMIRSEHDDVLRDVADPNVHAIVYTGHSQIGGTVEQALQQRNFPKGSGRKLITLLQCVGTQTLPLLRARLPEMDVITSRVPLYVSEIGPTLQAIYKGLEQGDSYARIRNRIGRPTSVSKRLVFPDQTQALRHVDFDVNGWLDASQPAGKFHALDGRSRIAAGRLMSGVHFLETLNPYYAEQTPGAVFTLRQASTPVVAVGIERGDGQSVTRIRERTDGTGRRFEVALDDKFARAPKEFVGAATVFELQLHLQNALINRATPREKVRALAFTGEYLSLMGRDHAAADRALKRVAKRAGLPALDLSQVESALAGTHIIGEAQVDALERMVAGAQGIGPR